MIRKTLFIPANLRLDELLKSNPPTFSFKRDKFVYISSVITEQTNKYKDRILPDDGFVPLSSTRLMYVVDNYRQYLDYLLDNQIIESDNQFIIGEKCIHYRLVPTYWTIVAPVVINDFTLCNRIIPSYTRKGFHPFNINGKKQYPKLFRYFNPKLVIDDTAAKKFLSEQFYQSDQMATDIARFNNGYFSVENLTAGNYLFKPGEKGHRLYTNLTCMQSDLRRYITYNEQSLVEVDIKTCQLWLTQVLLDERFYYSTTTDFEFNIHNVVPDLIPSIFPPEQDLYYTIMFVKTLKTPDNSWIPEIESYYSTITDHDFYNFMGREYYDEAYAVQTHREKIKKVISYILYSDDNECKAHLKDVFLANFPQVIRVFTMIKQQNHANLAIVMQRIESKLMLQKVTPKFLLEHPGVPLFTIHDSIVCPIGYEEHVQQIIREESIKCIGLTPRFGVKIWEPVVDIAVHG